jgi:Fe-S-cluster-containing dehydrogenase component
MENQSRRSFLKTTAVLSATIAGISSKPAKAEAMNILSDDRYGVLVDTTACIGCRKCEWACKNAHNLPNTDIDTYDDRSVFKEMRRPGTTSLTVVNEYPSNSGFPTDVKVQCMHCDHPACVSACIVGAFSKQENGAVLWDTDKCIGCRYCMVACPFQVPAFEYEKAIAPKIVKCDFCFDRTKEGGIPACVEICPMEVLTFGRKEDLIRVAREKIRLYPDRYLNNVYGESEVGGTSWMYLVSKEPEQLGFPKLGRNPAPGVSEAIQHGIFAYFIPPIALYALLGGVMWINKNKKKPESEQEI